MARELCCLAAAFALVGFGCDDRESLHQEIQASLQSRRADLVQSEEALRGQLRAGDSAGDARCPAAPTGCQRDEHQHVTFVLPDAAAAEVGSMRLRLFDESAAELLSEVEEGDLSKEGAQVWLNRVQDPDKHRFELVIVLDSWVEPDVAVHSDFGGQFSPGEASGRFIVFDHESSEIRCSSAFNATSSERFEYSDSNEQELEQRLVRDLRSNSIGAACGQM